MKRYYRMAVRNKKTGETDTYVSERQGASPSGWECTGVCGYFEKEGSADLGWMNRRFFMKGSC